MIRGDTKNHKTIYTIYVHMYRLNCCDHVLSLHSTYSMHVQLDVVCMHSRTYAVHTYVYIDEIQLIKCIESCCPRSTYCACRAWQSLLPHTTICRRIFGKNVEKEMMLKRFSIFSSIFNHRCRPCIQHNWNQ